MPSGITSDIYDGKDVSLRDYLMVVGRQMGFAYHQRDDPWDTPVKPPAIESSYAEKQLPGDKEDLIELLQLTPEQIAERAQESYKGALASWKEGKAKKEELLDRYEDMLEQVEAWDCDPLMESTKENAIKFLQESIEFDCKVWERPERETPEDWYVRQIQSASRIVIMHLEDIQKARQRADEHWAYYCAFMRSLPEEPGDAETS